MLLLMAGQVATAAPMNVLFIVSDDLRTEMGCYGGNALTPNLDKLAASNGAVLFERSYVQQAICCPTRSSFLTGRRPDTTKVWDLKTQFRDAPGGKDWKTLPQYFRENGYWTAGMGKVFHPVAYNGSTDDIAGGSWSAPYFHASGEDNKHKLTATNCGVADPINDDDAYSDGKLAQHAVMTLRQAKNMSKPFFIAVGLHRPHLPWVVPKKYFDLYPPEDQIPLADYNSMPLNYNATGAQQWSWDPQSGPRHCGPLFNLTHPKPVMGEYALVDNATSRHFRRSYWAAVSYLDRNVGVVLDELEALGLHENTVVSFIGDHGWQLGDLGEFGKKTNFERATRAPMIIRDPSRSASMGAKSLALVEFVDLMPTLIDLALGAANVPPTCPIDSSGVAFCTEGQSLKAVMAEPVATKDARGAAFMQYASCMHDEGVWHDGCKGPMEPRVMGYAMRTRRWRYIEWVRFNKTAAPQTAMPLWDQLVGTELYDHSDGAGGDSVGNAAESVNLVAEPRLAQTVAVLSKQLRAGWRVGLERL